MEGIGQERLGVDFKGRIMALYGESKHSKLILTVRLFFTVGGMDEEYANVRVVACRVEKIQALSDARPRAFPGRRRNVIHGLCDQSCQSTFAKMVMLSTLWRTLAQSLKPCMRCIHCPMT